MSSTACQQSMTAPDWSAPCFRATLTSLARPFLVLGVEEILGLRCVCEAVYSHLRAKANSFVRSCKDHPVLLAYQADSTLIRIPSRSSHQIRGTEPFQRESVQKVEYYLQRSLYVSGNTATGYDSTVVVAPPLAVCNKSSWRRAQSVPSLLFSSWSVSSGQSPETSICFWCIVQIVSTFVSLDLNTGDCTK